MATLQVSRNCCSWRAKPQHESFAVSWKNAARLECISGSPSHVYCWSEMYPLRMT